MPESRKTPAAITNREGVELIKSLIWDIDANTDLQMSGFGMSVRSSLVSMQSRLKEGAYFTERMEGALYNWATAIQKWNKSAPQEFEGEVDRSKLI